MTCPKRPDLRGQRLTLDVKFSYEHLCLVINNILRGQRLTRDVEISYEQLCLVINTRMLVNRSCSSIREQ